MGKVFAALLFSTLGLFLASNLVLATDPPTLNSPSSGSTTSDISPKLSWSWTGTCASSGSCFRVQVDDQSDFSSVLKDYYTSNTDYSPQLSEGTWYWRVKAKDASSWSDWSSIWNFIIGQGSSPTSQPQPTQTTNPTAAPAPGGGQVILSEFLPNPESGNEWVELFNPSASSLDISGYKIDDIEGGSSPFTIPQGTVIGGGNYIYFSFSSRLNNDGDSTRLLNSSSQIIEEYAYGKSQKGVSFAKDLGGLWQETTTITPGGSNVITAPLAESSTTKTSSSKSSKEIKTSPTPTVAGIRDSSPQKKTAKAISQESSDYVLPETTTTAQIEEATPEAEVLGTSPKRNILPALFLGGAGVILLAGAFLRYLKFKKK